MALSQSVPDAASFETAIHEESGPLFGVAYSILRDAHEAEDAVQETMELAWKAWAELRDPAKRSAWLRKICVRRCLQVRRRLFPRRWLADHPAADRWVEPAADPDLDRSYGRLTRQQRAVIVLHYHYGYTLDESADLLGCAPGTARSHLARALNSLRKELSYE